MKNIIGEGKKMIRKFQLAAWLSIYNFYSHFTKVTRKCKCFGHIVEPWLRNQTNHQYHSEITWNWWCEGGRNIKRTIDWLEENFETEFQLHGDIWLYVWIGTCDLTSRDSSTGYITLTSTRDKSIIEKISEGYQEIARIL